MTRDKCRKVYMWTLRVITIAGFIAVLIGGLWIQAAPWCAAFFFLCLGCIAILARKLDALE